MYRDVPRDRIPEVRWYAAFRPVGRPSATALADFSGGTPALSELRMESGRWLICWAPLNAPYSDLSLRSLFVPFVGRLVEYLAADLGERRGEFLVGETASRELVASLPGDAAIEVVRPDGATVRPGVEQLGSRRRITYEDTDLPGVYTIMVGDRAVDAFAVNVDPVEMAGPTITPEELARRWAGYSVVIVAPGESLSDTVTRMRYGTEIGPLFLWVVAGLFFLEMFLARTKRRDFAPPETAASPPA